MAQPYVTGPVSIWVQFPGVTQAAFLGTAERCPRMQVRAAWEPLFNDIGGQRIPFDVLFEGEEGYIFADLTRWNQATANVMVSRPGAFAGLPGLNVPGDIGTAMILEGKTCHVYLVFPFAAKPAMANAANGALMVGYHWPACILEGPDDMDEMGTRPRKVRFIWHALRQYDPQTGSFMLYDFVMAGNITLFPPN